MGGMKGAVSGLGSVISGVAKGLAVFGLALDGLKKLGGLVSGLVETNSQMEMFETQLGTLLAQGDGFAAGLARAKDRMAELSQFAASTPFEMPEIAKAEKVLVGFGLQGQRALDLTGKSASDLRTVVGDIAAGTGVAFDEMAVTLGKFSTGATGEAIARLQELGIVTKEELSGMGIEFDKAGSLVSPVSDALTAAITVAEGKFGGGMANLSATFGGLVSTLQDTWSFLVADFASPVFDQAKVGVQGLISVLSSERVQQFATSLGVLVGEGITNAAGAVSAAISWFSEFQGALAGTTALAGPLGTAIEVFRTFGEVLSGMASGVNFEALLGETGLAGIAPLLTSLMPGMESMASGLQRMREAVTPLAVALQALLAGDYAAFFSGLGAGLQELIAGFVQTRVAVFEMTVGLVAAVVEMVPQLATALFGWLQTQAPVFLAQLAALGQNVLTWIMSFAPILGQTVMGWAQSLGGWVMRALPVLITGLATFAASLFDWIVTMVPMITGTVIGWAQAFVAWIFDAKSRLVTSVPTLLAGVLEWARSAVPALISTFFEWAAAVASWIPGAIGRLATGVGQIIGQVVAFLITAVPKLLSTVIKWAFAIGGFAIKAIPIVLEGLGRFVVGAVEWLITSGLPMLVKAAINLASGLVKGFLSALQGGLEGGGAGLGDAMAGTINGAEPKAMSAWQTFKMNQEASGADAAAAAEMGLMRDDQRLARAAGAMIGGAKSAIQAQAPDLAAAAGAAGAGAADALAGGMDAGGAGADAGAGAGAGGGAAAVDPAQQAMQQIQSVSSAVSSVIDLAEKAFSFRGMPPPEIMDEIFDGLKDIMERGMELAAGTDLLAAQLGQAVGQMLQGFVSALTGMVDLAEKLARFRVPSPESLSSLLDLGVAISDIITELTNVLGEGDLADSLEGSTIASKVAEMLGKWVETLTGMAEMTTALAKARWDVDMGPVTGFIAGIATFAIELQESLATGRERFNLVIADTGALGEALTPWVDMMTSIAELSADLIRIRWPKDLSAPLGLLDGIAEFAFEMHDRIKAQLGPQVLIAIDDTKLLGETIQPWIDAFKGVAEAAQALVGVRFGNVQMDAAGGLLTSIWGMVSRFSDTARTELGPGILVALEDSREIADTLGAWLDPLTKVADVVTSIDVVRRLAQTRSDTTLTALWDFVSQFAVMTARFVETGNNRLQAQLLIALEDSREIAETLGAWLDPLSKIADVALAFDVVRNLAHTRWDNSLTAAWDLISGIAVMTARFVSSGNQILGAELIALLTTSRDIAETLSAWLDPLTKVGDVAQSIDVVRRIAQTRWDSTFTNVAEMLAGIGSASAQIVYQVQRWADPSGQLEISKLVAQTFGAWLDIMAKLGEATDSIRRTHSVDDTVLTDMVRMLATVGSASNDIVQAVQRASNPTEQLKISQQVAQTFDAWTSTFATIRDATEALRDVRSVPEENLDLALGLMQRIAAKTSTMVAAVLRHADPGPVLEASQKVAETLGAWLDAFSVTADLTHAMVGAEPVSPAELSIVQGLISAAYGILVDVSADLRRMGDLAREDFMDGLMAYAEAAGAAVDLIKSSAEIDLRDVVPIDEQARQIVKANMAAALDTVKALADDWLPELDGAAKRMLERLKAYIDIAGAASGLISSSASLGADVFGAEFIRSADLANVEGALRQVVSSVERLAGWWAEGKSRLTESTKEMTSFAEAAGAAVGLVKPTVEAIQALASPDIGSVSMIALARVQSAIFAIMGVIESLARGYLDAKGELDAARTGAIAGFADSAGAAVGAVSDTVGLLVDLHESQGQIGSLSGTVKAQIRAGIQSIVSMMQGLATDYGMATLEARRALQQTVDFSGSVSSVADAVGSVVGSLKDVWEFAFEQNEDTGKITPIVRDFGAHVRESVSYGISAIVDVMDRVMDDLGPEALAQAQLVATRVGPVADAIGGMLEPIQKLMENPFVDTKNRSAWGRRTAQNRIKHMADNVSKGIKLMAKTLIKALEGVKLPSGIDKNFQALVTVVAGLMDVIDRSLMMPEIDFGRLEDLVKASQILGGIQMPAYAGAAAGGGGGGTAQRGSPLLPGVEMPTPGGPINLSGPVTVIGPTFIDKMEATLEADGKVLGKIQGQGATKRAETRESRGPAA